METRRKVLAGMAGVVASGALPRIGKAATGSAKADTASLQINGPVKGGAHGWSFGAFFGDISKLGYIEEEYFVEGDAHSFERIGAFSADGNWDIKKSRETRPFRTRIIVRRPISAEKFNGTVLVEWANVTRGHEKWVGNFPGVYEDGFAYVSISAQPEGIDGAEADPSGAAKVEFGLKDWDPERYGPLVHPGEGYSYDIFTQCARAMGPDRPDLGDADPMGGLQVRKLIALGYSQSGTRLASYINGVQPIENLFDAIIPIVYAGFTTDWQNITARQLEAMGTIYQSYLPSKLRETSARVLALNSEAEAQLYFPLRQENTDKFRYWEVAGTAHRCASDMRTDLPMGIRDAVYPPGFTGSDWQGYNDVSWTPTLHAAIRHVQRWINGGEAPPAQPFIEISADDRAIVRDEFGNALGGVRLPELEAPVARHVGLSQNSDFDNATMFGETVPLPREQLASLYPTHEDYVEKVRQAAESSVAAGVIVPSRAGEYVEQAKRFEIPACPSDKSETT